MPEALAILLICSVAVSVYVVAWVRSRRPSIVPAQADLARLERHEAWLVHRLELAGRERWDSDMVRRLEADLHATRQALATARAVGDR